VLPPSISRETLEAVARAGILKNGGWVIGQHHAKEPPVRSAAWQLFRQEKYGDTRLSFFVHA
jgi:16S rRNA G966 N2-methylase RsmD